CAWLSSPAGPPRRSSAVPPAGGGRAPPHRRTHLPDVPADPTPPTDLRHALIAAKIASYTLARRATQLHHHCKGGAPPEGLEAAVARDRATCERRYLALRAQLPQVESLYDGPFQAPWGLTPN